MLGKVRLVTFWLSFSFWFSADTDAILDVLAQIEELVLGGCDAVVTKVRPVNFAYFKREVGLTSVSVRGLQPYQIQNLLDTLRC
jgi:hypothetical protein